MIMNIRAAEYDEYILSRSSATIPTTAQSKLVQHEIAPHSLTVA